MIWYCGNMLEAGQFMLADRIASVPTTLLSHLILSYPDIPPFAVHVTRTHWHSFEIFHFEHAQTPSSQKVHISLYYLFANTHQSPCISLPHTLIHLIHSLNLHLLIFFCGYRQRRGGGRCVRQTGQHRQSYSQRNAAQLETDQQERENYKRRPRLSRWHGDMLLGDHPSVTSPIFVTDYWDQIRLSLSLRCLPTIQSSQLTSTHTIQFNTILPIHSIQLIYFPDANFIKCHTDELIGFAFALKIPIIMSAQVFDTLSVTGLLTKVQQWGLMDGIGWNGMRWDLYLDSWIYMRAKKYMSPFVAPPSLSHFAILQAALLAPISTSDCTTYLFL